MTRAREGKMREKMVFPQPSVEVLEETLRRCAIELSYIEVCATDGCPDLVWSAESKACIEEIERLLGPMKEWVRLYPASESVNRSMR